MCPKKALHEKGVMLCCHDNLGEFVKYTENNGYFFDVLVAVIN